MDTKSLKKFGSFAAIGGGLLWLAAMFLGITGCTQEGDTIFGIESSPGAYIEWTEQTTSGEGSPNIIDDSCGECGGESEIPDGRCWSTCESKTVLPASECDACARQERSCVWPWEVDEVCLTE